MSNSDYGSDYKIFTNAEARMIFGDGVFEFMVPEGDPVEVAFSQQPDSKFYLTINNSGTVTVRCAVEPHAITWHGGILDEQFGA